MQFRRRLAAALITLGLLGSAASQAAAQSVLRIGVPALPPGQANPYLGFIPPSVLVWATMFDSLTLVDGRDQTVKPWLATEWIEETPTQWRIRLREDVRFWNGEKLTADSVVGTLAYLKSEQGRITMVGQELAEIVSAQALDPVSVRFTLKNPNPLFPALLGIFLVLDHKHLEAVGMEAFARNPMGSGPYKLERWTPSKASFTASPHAWVKPPSDTLEILGIAEQTSRLQALLSGAIDLNTSLDPADIERFTAEGGRILKTPFANTIGMMFVTNRESAPFFQDARVRRAVNYAVNKEALTTVLLSGVTEPGSQPAPKGVIGYDPAIEPYPYDPAKAKTLLAEAGYESGFTFTANFTTELSMLNPTIAQQIAVDLANVGITMRILPQTTAQTRNNYYDGEWRGEAFTTTYNADPTGDALRAMRFHSCLHPNPWVCDREIQPTIEAGLSAGDLETRRTLARQVSRRYHDEAYALFLYDAVLVFGLGPRLSAFDAVSNRLLYGAIELTR
jgi:peptide/nickel transport system substrate-binding protein